MPKWEYLAKHSSSSLSIRGPIPSAHCSLWCGSMPSSLSIAIPELPGLSQLNWCFFGVCWLLFLSLPLDESPRDKETLQQRVPFSPDLAPKPQSCACVYPRTTGGLLRVLFPPLVGFLGGWMTGGLPWESWTGSSQPSQTPSPGTSCPEVRLGQGRGMRSQINETLKWGEN